MKIIFVLLISAIYSCNSNNNPSLPAPTTTGPAILDQIQAPLLKNFEYILNGDINNALPAIMQIQNTNGNVSGKYFYVRQGYDISLFGKAYGDKIELYETDINGNKTASFEGILDNNIFKGTWQNLQSKQTYPFKFTVSSKKIQEIPAGMEGNYTLTKDGADTCNLTIRISKNNNDYSYELKTTRRSKRGKLLIERSFAGEEIYVGFEGLAWDSWEGDVTKDRPGKELAPPSTISGLYEPGKISIQNYGNAMNNYTKLSECSEKYLILQKR